MMKVIIFLLVMSEGLIAKSYFIDGKKTSLMEKVITGKYNSIISKECFYKNSCLALIALKKSRDIKIVHTADEGLSVGNQVCRKYLDGKINYARDKDGNEINLCQFRDGSMIDLSSVTP
jgi:hypothetical protein